MFEKKIFFHYCPIKMLIVAFQLLLCVLLRFSFCSLKRKALESPCPLKRGNFYPKIKNWSSLNTWKSKHFPPP